MPNNDHLVPGMKVSPPLPREDGKKIANMSCRNPNCDSMTVEILEIPGNNHTRLYRCTECGQPMPVSVGGPVGF